MLRNYLFISFHAFSYSLHFSVFFFFAENQFQAEYNKCLLGFYYFCLLIYVGFQALIQYQLLQCAVQARNTLQVCAYFIFCQITL